MILRENDAETVVERELLESDIVRIRLSGLAQRLHPRGLQRAPGAF